MNERQTHALELLQRFAQRTGVTSDRPPRRYLWTDAFAVCTLLGLGRALGRSECVDLALRLVDQVHHVLGRHRSDDRRQGWISGLDEARGAAHPTCGGLRIGKPLPERRADQVADERSEWDRDGQYFHYLTKWMHALDQLAAETGQPLFNQWARELADVAHRAFTSGPRGGPKRMCWKRSIDLSRALVGSMGQHDPLDGLVTYAQLTWRGANPDPDLSEALADFADMVEPQHLASADPLGIGGLLVDAWRIAQLARHGIELPVSSSTLLEAALLGVRHYRRQPDLSLPPARRLAFRELGLAIGLAAAARPGWPAAAQSPLERLSEFGALRHEIEATWLRPEQRSTDSWRAHEDINDMMLAASLCPDGMLQLSAPAYQRDGTTRAAAVREHPE